MGTGGEEMMVMRAESVAYQKIDEGGVLLHLETGAYHRINAIGALIWEAIEDTTSVGEIVRGLEEMLEGPPPVSLAADVQEFIGSLEQRDLLVVAPA